MAQHRMYLESVGATGDLLLIEGDEAKHAVRVKRVEPGEHVELLDGAGAVARGEVLDRHAVPGASEHARREWVLPIRVLDVQRQNPVIPAVHVFSATPKGANLEQMIDGLCQVGAASWTPLQTKRGVVDPREGKLARIERVAVEASKQCGRAWVLRVGARAAFASSLASAGPVVMADASGGAYEPTGQAAISALIGPEGGWAPEELDAARKAGVRICSFGPHAMRIETAAVAAAAIILSRELRK